MLLCREEVAQGGAIALSLCWRTPGRGLPGSIPDDCGELGTGHGVCSGAKDRLAQEPVGSYNQDGIPILCGQNHFFDQAVGGEFGW